MKACIIDCTADKFMTRGSLRRTCSSAYSIGMKCVETDFNSFYGNGNNKLPRAHINDIRYYDIAFLPLTSVQEIESFVLAISNNKDYRKNKATIIAGGAGLINIFPIIDYIDVAVWGRCDKKQIIDIMQGKYGDNVWNKKDDPYCEKKYSIGQHKSKHRFETGTIGCRLKCDYCHYSHVRIYDNLPYSPQKGAAETDIWASDFSFPRVHVTAIDGLSEKTRRKVNKPISDEFLIKKISAFYSEKNRNKTVGIKFYNIVGYPWETKETIEKDYNNLVDLLSSIDRKTGKWKCRITIQHTPFSPEPITPMERCLVDIHINFRDIFKKEYKGIDLTIKTTPFLQGKITRAKRLAINRCNYSNRKIVQSFLSDKCELSDIEPITKNNKNIVSFLKRPLQYNTDKFKNYEF